MPEHGRGQSLARMTMSGMRVVLMPRWSGTARSDWYDWLAGELDVSVSVAELDQPDRPTIAGCVESLGAAVAPDPGEVCLVGHSVGCLAILHLLATSSGLFVPAAVFIAGWWTIDAPWDTIRPWLDTPIDTDAARRAVGETRVVISDNDPFTSDAGLTERTWRERMGSEVQVVPGAAHFNRAQEPAVLSTLRGLLAGAADDAHG
jgi:uncharacterized protein